MKNQTQTDKTLFRGAYVDTEVLDAWLGMDINVTPDDIAPERVVHPDIYTDAIQPASMTPELDTAATIRRLLQLAYFETYLEDFQPNTVIGGGNADDCVIATYLSRRLGLLPGQQDLFTIGLSEVYITTPFGVSAVPLPKWAEFISRCNAGGESLTAAGLWQIIWRMK